VATTVNLIIAALRIMEAHREGPRAATTRPRSARILTWATVIMETSAPMPTVTKISESPQAVSPPRVIAGFQLEPPQVDHLQPCLLPLSSTRHPKFPWEIMPSWQLASPRLPSRPSAETPSPTHSEQPPHFPQKQTP
jgi:hypothetical protein